ncbi:MAG: radical SAM protein [Spirochaetota bacterium]|nr:radical SAM protein [Spirochaetota bacterium]
MSLSIPYLVSGGIITNYSCSSRCRHCLYGCSPQRDRTYIHADTINTVCAVLLKNGCTSVHVGGGEPFLQIEKLLEAIDIITSHGIDIEYIETNASWYNNNKKHILRNLTEHGVHTLLISISPFHNEFVPFSKTKELIATCNDSGIHVFPWVMDFYKDLSVFDSSCTHSLEEYESYFGKGYVASIPGRYWIHYGGRALKLFKGYYRTKPLEEILASPPCREITNTSHFHFDVYGNYIPGLCSGLAIQADDIGKEIDSITYPFITTLYSEGVAGLYRLAQQEGFVAASSYLNKCDLCLHIRTFFVTQKKMNTPELQPVEFYYNT